MIKSNSSSLLSKRRNKHKRSLSDPICFTQPIINNKDSNSSNFLTKINTCDKKELNEFKKNFSILKTCFGLDKEDSTCNILFSKYLKDFI